MLKTEPQTRNSNSNQQTHQKNSKNLQNQKFILFWALNPYHNFTPELIEKTLNLKCHSQNIIIKIRQQKWLDIMGKSLLDFFFSPIKFNL